MTIYPQQKVEALFGDVDTIATELVGTIDNVAGLDLDHILVQSLVLCMLGRWLKLEVWIEPAFDRDDHRWACMAARCDAGKIGKMDAIGLGATRGAALAAALDAFAAK